MTSLETSQATQPAQSPCHESAQPVSHAIRNFLVDRRVALSSLMLVGLVTRSVVLGTPDQTLAANYPLASVLGYALVLCGVAIRSWAAGVLPKGRGLATTGPYGYCRHPLYLGSILALAGLAAVVLDLLGTCLLVTVLLAIYGSTIAREERRLPQKFGAAWTAYKAITPCLAGWRLPVEFGNWSLRQWLRSREYRALLSALAGLAFATVWQMHALDAPALRAWIAVTFKT